MKDLLKKVRRIDLVTKKIVDSLFSGQYHTRFKGQGMQFSDFREYYPGDDIRHIDWKVSARSEHTHIKKFEEERDLTVYLLLDMSSSGEFGTQTKSNREALVELCALLAFSAIKNNDKVGLILFTSEVEKHIPPKKGKAHALRLVTEMLRFEPKHKGTKISSALNFYNNLVPHSGVVFLASDFWDLSFERELKRTSRRHDLIALYMQEVQNQEKLNAMVEWQDLETGEILYSNPASYLIKKNQKDLIKKKNLELSTLLKKHEVDLVSVFSNEDYFDKVVQFFKKRSKRR
jgi:uncharacterized protein (DUF58 family)